MWKKGMHRIVYVGQRWVIKIPRNFAGFLENIIEVFASFWLCCWRFIFLKVEISHVVFGVLFVNFYRKEGDVGKMEFDRSALQAFLAFLLVDKKDKYLPLLQENNLEKFSKMLTDLGHTLKADNMSIKRDASDKIIGIIFVDYGEWKLLRLIEGKFGELFGELLIDYLDIKQRNEFDDFIKNPDEDAKRKEEFFGFLSRI